jgi:hypothetical protein
MFRSVRLGGSLVGFQMSGGVFRYVYGSGPPGYLLSKKKKNTVYQSRIICVGIHCELFLVRQTRYEGVPHLYTKPKRYFTY